MNPFKNWLTEQNLVMKAVIVYNRLFLVNIYSVILWNISMNN